MSEYIDRDKLIEALKEWQKTLIETYGDNDEYVRCLESVLTGIDNIPAADVRPVVFCKDCKWYQIDELKKDGTEDRRYKPSVCVLAEQRRDPNHFCADGEKREES